MKWRDWFGILFFESLTVAAVMGLFKVLDPAVAGIFGGILFSFLGIYVGLFLIRRKTYFRSLTFWWLFVYLFYSVLPLLLVRLTNWGVDFNQLKVWGVMGADFHRISSEVFLILIGCSFVDLLIVIFQNIRRRFNK